MSALLKPSDDAVFEHDWLRLRPLILKAVKWLPGYDEADLLRAVMSGGITFWPGERSFIFAAIERHPKLTRLHFVLFGGDHNEAAGIEPRIVAWAKRHGATEAFTSARVGLDRLNVRGEAGYYSDSGYKRSRVVYVKEI